MRELAAEPTEGVCRAGGGVFGRYLMDHTKDFGMLLDLGMSSPDGRTFLQKKAPKLFRASPKDPFRGRPPKNPKGELTLSEKAAFGNADGGSN